MNSNKENDPQGQDIEIKEDNNSKEEGDKKNEAALTTSSEEKSSALSKVLGFLSLGIAGLAIFLSLAVMKKVDNNFGKVNSSIKEIKTNTSSLKTEMDEKLGYVDFEINGIKSKVEKSQRIAVIMELKRALVTVQDASLVESSPELQAKSKQLISNIESYLHDLGETKKKAGIIEVKEAPKNVSEKK